MIKTLLNAIEATLLADPRLAYLNQQIISAVNGLFPAGWVNNAVVLSPVRQTPLQYPADVTNHLEMQITVYCYSEYFGERIGLMGEENYKGVLDVEQDIRDVLTPGSNADFDAFDGLVSACFWKETVYPDFDRRTFQAWNEALVTFTYRN